MPDLNSLRRAALVLVVIGLLWNMVEAGVSLWAGAAAGSVAMLAFGLDSIVELFAGGVLVWRLTAGQDESKAEVTERRAQKLVGISFLLLAMYVVLHSGSNLLGWLPEAQPSLIGVALVASSALVMAVLYVAKMRIATSMQSRSLRAEAIESLFCDLQDLTILIGLGLNALFAWWWADPVSVLLLVPFFVREGLENLVGHEEESGRDPLHVCICRVCFYGLRICPPTCSRA